MSPRRTRRAELQLAIIVIAAIVSTVGSVMAAEKRLLDRLHVAVRPPAISSHTSH